MSSAWARIEVLALAMLALSQSQLYSKMVEIEQLLIAKKPKQRLWRSKRSLSKELRGSISGLKAFNLTL
jgi:hypothetical protein